VERFDADVVFDGAFNVRATFVVDKGGAQVQGAVKDHAVSTIITTAELLRRSF